MSSIGNGGGPRTTTTNRSSNTGATDTGAASTSGGEEKVADPKDGSTGGALPNMGDGYEAKRSGLKMTPKAVETQNQALDKFNTTFSEMFKPNARQLAAGVKPADPNNLTEAQKDKMVDATKDVLTDMPVAALAPGMGASLKSFLDKRGIDTTDIESKKVGDLGDYAGDWAKQTVDNLRDEKPGVFYGLAATAATAVGAAGFTQGSKVLKDIGIKPEVKLKMFDKKLELRTEAMWGKKFADPGLHLRGTYKFDGGGRLQAGVKSEVVDDNRLTNFSLAASGRLSEHWTGRANANYDTDKNFSLAGQLDYANGPWTGQVRGGYDNLNGGYAGAGVQYNPSDNFSLNAGGSWSEKDGAQARIGIGWTF